MNITFRKANELSLEELLALWNNGFEGYYVNLTLSLHQLLNKLVNEDIQLDVSCVMYDGDLPIGFNLNGIRTVTGRVIAWNGGTAIIPTYRDKKLGQLLMQESLSLYKQANVGYATLEAFCENARAIKLYSSQGYSTIEQIQYYSYPGTQVVGFPLEYSSEQYQSRLSEPAELGSISFYNGSNTWQSQWQSVKGGLSLIVTDNEEDIGYALFKNSYSQQGELVSIALYQCEVNPMRKDGDDIISYLLSYVFGRVEGNHKRIVINLPERHLAVMNLLQKLGFVKIFDMVHMSKTLSGELLE